MLIPNIKSNLLHHELQIYSSGPTEAIRPVGHLPDGSGRPRTVVTNIKIQIHYSLNSTQGASFIYRGKNRIL